MLKGGYNSRLSLPEAERASCRRNEVSNLNLRSTITMPSAAKAPSMRITKRPHVPDFLCDCPRKGHHTFRTDFGQAGHLRGA